MRKPTRGMLRALRNLKEGKAFASGLGHGMSVSGGLTQTWTALIRRGWIDKDGQVTDEGREALQQYGH